MVLQTKKKLEAGILLARMANPVTQSSFYGNPGDGKTCIMLKVMLLGMLSLPGAHTPYPVIVQAKKFAYALIFDTSAGSKFIDAVRRV